MSKDTDGEEESYLDREVSESSVVEIRLKPSTIGNQKEGHLRTLSN